MSHTPRYSVLHSLKTRKHYAARLIPSLFLLIAVVCIFPVGASAQDAECGAVILPEQVEAARALHNSVMALKAPLDDTVFVDIPIAYHIIRQSSGIGGFSTYDLEASTDSANVLFAPLYVGIYQYSLDYIDDDYFYYGTGTTSDYDSLRRINAVPEAINIYYLPSESTFPYCGLSSFTFSSTQGILMSNDCAGASIINSTLAHEIGHYFDLFHTHETAYGEECPDGSNCTIAGDLICDTPADPTLSSGTVDEFCVYIGAESSPGSCNFDLYDPQPDNLMSYSRKSCRDLTTPQQIEKFRITLLTLRPELAFSIGGVFYLPATLTSLPVLVGETLDTAITVTNTSVAPLEVTSATSTTGEVTISASLPITLNQDESVSVQVAFDASLITDPCDIGSRFDTVLITTDNPQRPEIIVPVNPVIMYAIPAQERSTFGPACLNFTVPNTPGIGDRSSSGLVGEGYGNILYDGSLILGLIDGSNTVAFMDMYGTAGFSVIDAYAATTDVIGRSVQTIRFATGDNRLQGEIAYHYGYNSLGIDSCGSIEIDYTVSNPCDTALTIVAGIFCDFDIDDSGNNDAFVDGDMVVVTTDAPGSVQSAALMTLDSPGLDPNLRVISNPDLIYPTNGLTPTDAYHELTQPTSTETLDDIDVSALMSFGEVTIAPESAVVFRSVILYSNTGLIGLADARTNALALTDSYLCGDANSDEAVNIGDAVFLINYAFKGGPPPEPLAAGDANCDDSVDVGDAVYIINYAFKGGPDPCASCP